MGRNDCPTVVLISRRFKNTGYRQMKMKSFCYFENISESSIDLIDNFLMLVERLLAIQNILNRLQSIAK